ncbi:MAG: hypothetical protein OXI80_14940, partial [Caldilineaceae bacterium]|nr:hypothetical protein [Caldilineaceae bacterium]
RHGLIFAPAGGEGSTRPPPPVNAPADYVTARWYLALHGGKGAETDLLGLYLSGRRRISPSGAYDHPRGRSKAALCARS